MPSSESISLEAFKPWFIVSDAKVRKYWHCIPIVPTRGITLWEETATARTIGMSNNEGMQRQLPPGNVCVCGGGGGMSKSPPLNSVELAKRRAKTEQF